MSNFELLDAMFGCDSGGNAYECAVCRTECDREDGDPVILDGEDICPECREICDGGCGEWLCDETVASCGPVVHFRDWALNGKLQKAHASCAATTMLSYLIDDYSYDHTTRAEVAAVFEMVTA